MKNSCLAEAFEIAGREVISNRLDPAVYAWALASCDGDAERAKAAYIKARVVQLETKLKEAEARRVSDAELARKTKIEEADARYRARVAGADAERHRALNSPGYRFGRWLGRALLKR